MNVGIAIARTAKRWPENIAVFDGDRTRTFSQLDERSNQLANALLARGIKLGDRVALLIANRLEVLEVLGGCAKAGAVYCGLNFRLGEEEYEAIFENAQPRLLVTEPQFRELAGRLSERFGSPVVMLDDDGPDGYEALLAAAPSSFRPRFTTCGQSTTSASSTRAAPRDGRRACCSTIRRSCSTPWSRRSSTSSTSIRAG